MNIVLIERYPPSYASWPSLMVKKRIQGLSVEEVVRKYQGFEGELVFFFVINENMTELKKVIEECLELKSFGSCYLLHVISDPNVMPSLLKNQVVKLGYDVGVCKEEKTIYSSIFHEVIFGYFDELIVFKDLLNENLLFPNRAIAERYVAIHNDLSAQGKGVEDYEAMTIYEIWKHKE